jgi:hypothetical protein
MIEIWSCPSNRWLGQKFLKIMEIYLLDVAYVFKNSGIASTIRPYSVKGVGDF